MKHFSTIIFWLQIAVFICMTFVLGAMVIDAIVAPKNDMQYRQAWMQIYLCLIWHSSAILCLGLEFTLRKKMQYWRAILLPPLCFVFIIMVINAALISFQTPLGHFMLGRAQLKQLENFAGPMHTDKEWRTLAESGDEKAQSQQCGVHGFKNDIDTEYYRKVLGWCRTEADWGSAQAQFLLATSYAEGKNTLSQSWDDAYFWFKVWSIPGHITPKLNEAANHLTSERKLELDQRVAEWRITLCATKPTDRNQIIQRQAFCQETFK